MCIYLTTRHGHHRDGRANSVTAEWDLCPESNGRQPCPNQRRRERIVFTTRHEGNTTIGSIASASTVSSKGSITPASSYRDDSFVLDRSAEEHDQLLSSAKAPQDRWFPLKDKGYVETRKSARLSSQRRHRHRMSIDAALDSDRAKTPVFLRETSPSSGTNSEKGQVSRYNKVETNEDSAFADTTAWRLARETLRRQDREHRREETSSTSSVLEDLNELPEMHSLRLSDTEEQKEREEQMWDAHEVRTANRLEHRERIREENRRRRRLEEDLEREQQQPIEDVVSGDEDIARARLAREMAELEVEDGAAKEFEFEEARLLAERAVLDEKIALISLKQQKLEHTAQRDISWHATAHDKRRRSLAGVQSSRHGAQRPHEEMAQHLRRPERPSGRAHASNPSQSIVQTHEAQELRERIRENEQNLNEIEDRMRKRQSLEDKRKRQIRYLEHMIKQLDHKIAARSQRASPSSMGSGATRGTSSPRPGSSSRRSSPRDPIIEPAEEQGRASSSSTRYGRRRR